MLKSDRLYLAKFSVDPEMENEFDDIDFYCEDYIEESSKNRVLDSPIGNQEFESFFENQDEDDYHRCRDHRKAPEKINGSGHAGYG